MSASYKSFPDCYCCFYAAPQESAMLDDGTVGLWNRWKREQLLKNLDLFFWPSIGLGLRTACKWFVRRNKGNYCINMPKLNNMHINLSYLNIKKEWFEKNVWIKKKTKDETCFLVICHLFRSLQKEPNQSETAEVIDIMCCMNASQCVTSFTQKNKNCEHQNTVGFKSDYRNSPHT